MKTKYKIPPGTEVKCGCKKPDPARFFKSETDDLAVCSKCKKQVVIRGNSDSMALLINENEVAVISAVIGLYHELDSSWHTVTIDSSIVSLNKKIDALQKRLQWKHVMLIESEQRYDNK